MKTFAGIDLGSILAADEAQLRQIEYKFLDESAAHMGRYGMKIAQCTEELCDNIHNFYCLANERLYAMYKTADIPLNKKQINTFWELILKYQAANKYRPTENTPNWQTVLPAYRASISENFLHIDLRLQVIETLLKKGLQEIEPAQIYAFAIASYIQILQELKRPDCKPLQLYVKKVSALLEGCITQLQAMDVEAEEHASAKAALLPSFNNDNRAPSPERSFSNLKLTAF